MKVFFQGSFDILNVGHIRAFEHAAKYGELIIGLNTDELILRDKGHEPIIPFEQRKEILEGIKYISKVIACNQELALPYLKELNADVFVLTEEWRERHLSTGIKYMKAKGGTIVYSERYPDTLCSSDIRRKIRNMEEL